MGWTAVMSSNVWSKFYDFVILFNYKKVRTINFSKSQNDQIRNECHKDSLIQNVSFKLWPFIRPLHSTRILRQWLGCDLPSFLLRILSKALLDSSSSFVSLIKYSFAVNFINVKCACFSYERHFGSFFLCMYGRKKSCWNNICTKNARV